MDSRQWFNPHQPQTLQTLIILLYITAAFALLNGLLGSGVGLLSLAGIPAGYGLAQEKKWGYTLAAVVAIIPLAFTGLNLLSFGGSILVDVNTVIRLLFEIAIVVLVFHPMTREYKKIWFK